MAREWWLNQHPITTAAEDLLDFVNAARTLADRLRTCHRPADPLPSLRSLVASFEAPPGAGKTSFSNLLVAELVPRRDPAAPIPVRFSAELSRANELSLWTALAYRIGEALYRHFHRRALAAGDAGEIEIGSPLGRERLPLTLPTEGLAEQRLHWLEVAWRVSNAVPKEHWAPCLKLFNDAPSKIPGRRLDWRSATGTFLGLAKGGLYTATGQPGEAIGEAGAAAETLLRRPQIEGPSWGVDTEEFAGDLERLLPVLHPEAAHWRAIVVLDDLFRLDGAEAELHEALAYLRRLAGVLTIVNLDRGPGRLRAATERKPGAPPPAPRPAADAWPSEHPIQPQDGGALDALIDLRMPIPAPGRNELFGFARRFVEELDLPLTESEVSTFVRYLSDQGIRGAREIKKTLLWLWLRLYDPRWKATLFHDRPGAHSPPLTPDVRLGMLELLVDLHRFVEGRGSGARAFETAETKLPVLGHFPVCPWNLRPWIDRQETALGIAQDLVLHLRLLTLAQFVGVDHRTVGHQARARDLWRRWRQGVVNENPLQLETMDTAPPQKLCDHLKNRLQNGPGRGFATVLLASATRYFDGVAEAVAATSLREIWFEADLLVQRLEDRQAEPDARRRAWVVLNLLHPHVAEQLGAPPVSEDWTPTDEVLRDLASHLVLQRTLLKGVFDGTGQTR